MIASGPMPKESRVWIYQADREFTATEEELISKRAGEFVEKWTSHNQRVKAGYEIRYHRFLILMLDESHVTAGGCSIDSSVHFIRSLENDFQNTLTDRMKFAFKRNGQVEVVSKNEFEKLLAEGTVTGDTLVFNNLVPDKGELDSNWEVPMKSSWHKQFFTQKI
jgi:hypothetical protein